MALKDERRRRTRAISEYIYNRQMTPDDIYCEILQFIKQEADEIATRDEFAKTALGAMAHKVCYDLSLEGQAADIARHSYIYAEAMMKERDK